MHQLIHKNFAVVLNTIGYSTITFNLFDCWLIRNVFIYLFLLTTSFINKWMLFQ
jgi:hypothetical protein